ncbi:MAG TPA: trypsin-like peptidase domain-containing protein [Candidatus Fimimorpha excrementavium]|nr:trypsin-like peptidase domain-containing protein [Candidatus Fimimorpha excrementavium]
MTDEYRNDNESMEENVTAEGTQTADAADGQQGEQKDGFCFEEQRADNVDTSYRQPHPERSEGADGETQGYTSYGDAMHAKMEEMRNETTPPVRKLSRKERRQLKKSQKKSGKGVVIAVTAACVIVLAGIGAGAYGVVQYIDNNFVRKGDLISTVNSNQTADNASTSSSGGGMVAMDVSGIVAEVQPSVVAITDSLQYTTYYNNFFGQMQGQTQEATASGSGVIIGKNDTELLIVTNNHVVSNNEGSETTYSQYKVESVGLTVEFDDGSTGDAYVKGTDEEMDLAVIAVSLDSISADTLNQIKIASVGDSNNCQVGNGVIAIGNALGYGQSTTVGYISALNRTVTTEDGYSKQVIQVDAAINPGNSGGGLFNTKGELIGINSAKIAEEDVEGVGYAIPITDAEDIINELMNKTPVEEGEEGYLGVMGVSVPDQLVQGYGYPAGASVNQITEGSPAAEAGLRVYDIITGVNGRQITSFEQLQNVIHGYPAGETVELTVMRASSGNEFEELTISVTLAHQEDIQGAAEQTEPQPTQEAFIFR